MSIVQLRGYPKTVRIKDGSEITLRPMTAGDRDGVLAFFRALPEDDRMFLKHDVTHPEVVDRWVAGLDYEQVVPILAIRDDRVIADGTLHLNLHGWTRHIGDIRIVVARDHQGLGVGTQMARELVGLAQQRGLEKLQAEVVEDAMGAIVMFQKLGFRIEVVRRQHVLDLKGQHRNLVILVNNVEELWGKMEDLIQDTLAGGHRRDVAG
ncbi:MAG TPA: GNAT family N-acetyltransferase [Phycisphaerae bacterium]|nr:GNAT family N-acetyltransferase [Phycisphaerae bacterium]